jgi:uncharacterized protein
LILRDALVIDLAVSLPALFAGSVLGIVAFRNINETGFRRTILVLLIVRRFARLGLMV